MLSVKEFKVESKLIKGLKPDEKRMLPLLVNAVRKIEQVFLLQENGEYRGANFYSHTATKSEIEEKAEHDSKIFSPFTVVKKDKNGKLITINYHEEYFKLLKPISNFLLQASKISQNKSFKNYLETLASSLLNDDYQESDKAWLEIKNSNIDVIIGPHERYLDKLFFIKRAYQGSVSLIDLEKSEKAKFIRDILYTTIGERHHRVTPPSIVDIQVETCLMLSGFLANALFSRQHLPSDAETTRKYGSRIIGYLSVIDYKFEKLIYPVFNAIFEKSFKARYSKELLKKGNYFYVLLTAIAQQLHRYQNSRTRLRELFPVIDEANSVASGMYHAKHLVLKGVIDQKELEAILISLICWIFSEWIAYKENNVREDYLRGDALILNFLISESALKEKEGISWPNFAKIFFEMENLSVIFTRFLEEGSYLEVHEFLSKYLLFDSFRDFDNRLTKIKPLS